MLIGNNQVRCFASLLLAVAAVTEPGYRRLRESEKGESGRLPMSTGGLHDAGKDPADTRVISASSAR
jgi:hypothetical protein